MPLCFHSLYCSLIVGLLHAMAFMVLLLVGWVIWNNKPLPFQPIVFNWKQNSPSIAFASWSRIGTTWMRCEVWALSCLNRKFDISCKLGISRNPCSLRFRVNCIKKQAEVSLHCPSTWGDLVGLAPPKQSSKSPKTEIWSTIRQWCLFKFQNVKPPYRRLSGGRSVVTPSFSLGISLVTMVRF